MFTNKVNVESFGVEKEKEVALTKELNYHESYEETLEVAFY